MTLQASQTESKEKNSYSLEKKIDVILNHYLVLIIKIF